MKKLISLIVGIVMALAAPFALAMGGIESPANSNEFWYAATGGVPPN